MDLLPVCEIRINGALVTETFLERLQSCEVADKEGVSSDTVRATLNDYPPAEIPDTGDTIAVRMGFVGAAYDMGEFIIDEVKVNVLPGSIEIGAKAVDIAGDAKTNKERHWDDASITQIVSDVAGDLGLASRVDPSIGGFVYDWIGMQGESPIHFLERLAGRHGALFSIKSKKVIFAARGAGTAPGGAALTSTILTPAVIKAGTLTFTRSSRTEYGKVVATYMDRGQAKRLEVEVETGTEGDSDAVYRIQEPLASEAEAQRAARAKADELRRGELTFRCEVIGRPTARAGAPVVFQGCRPGFDGREWILSEATHRWSKTGGYTTTLAGTAK